MPRIYEYAKVSRDRLYCTDPDLVDAILKQMNKRDQKSSKKVAKGNYEIWDKVPQYIWFDFFLNALLDAGYEPFAVNGSSEIHLRKIV